MSGFVREPHIRSEEREELRQQISTALAPLVEEHKRWARLFGAALVLALQGDYSEVNRLAMVVGFTFDIDGSPILRSEVLHDSRSQSQGKDTSGACAEGLHVSAVYGL